MSEPDWAKVLQQIYKNKNGSIEWPLRADGWEKSIDGTGLSFEQEDEAIQFLHESGLLQKVDGKMDRSRQLTRRGFDVAHERELNKEQKIINRDIRNLTIILAFTASIQALAAAFSVSLLYQVLIVGFCVAVVITIIRYNFI